MPKPTSARQPVVPSKRGVGFAVVMGGFLGLSLLKFGNPPLMEKYVESPANVYELVLGFPWPISWAYSLLAVIAIWGAIVAFRDKPRITVPIWFLSLPAIWLGWQYLAMMDSVDPPLSRLTVHHFMACVVCFYLGYFCLRNAKGESAKSQFDSLRFVLGGLAVGLCLVIAVGWQQHFGGLKETRDYFYAYIYPTMKEVPAEYLKKMSSTRIFGTLFYPNALAGALVLLLPPVLGFIWDRSEERFTKPARVFLLLLIGGAGLACLYWSGSKGGWLLMIACGVLMLWRTPVPFRFKALVVALILVGGVSGFLWKYSGFFQKGATSVVARFDYWGAAVQVVRENPVLGTGPGTFAKPYARLKHPDSEMARLVHNDYLEQASDSGLPGLVFYAIFIVTGLIFSYQPTRKRDDFALSFLWVGLFAFLCQGLFEFGLYLPGLVWPTFTLMGYLISLRKPGFSEKEQQTGPVLARTI